MTDHTPAPKAIEALPELKPCPFCGCADIWIEPDERGSGGQHVSPYHIGCAACKVQMTLETEDEAATVWNTRALAAAQAEQAKPVPRIIGWIGHDPLGHPIARLTTAYDEEGNGWKPATAIYAAPPQADRADAGWIPVAHRHPDHGQEVVVRGYPGRKAMVMDFEQRPKRMPRFIDRASGYFCWDDELEWLPLPNDAARATQEPKP